MSDKEKLNDIPGQLDSIQKTRHIIDVLLIHPAFSSADAAELLLGLERLEAETVLTAPLVQDAREVVSSMLEKGFIPKEPADNFFSVLKDPRTADLLKKDVLPEINPAVTKPDTQVTPKGVGKGIGRRRFLVWGGLALGGLTLAGIESRSISNIVEYYFTPHPLMEKILRTPFAADELPPEWSQVRSYRNKFDNLQFAGGKFSEANIDIKMPGDRDSSTISFEVFESSEIAQQAFNYYKQPKSKSKRLVDGIGDDAALLELYNPPMIMGLPINGRCFVVVDRVIVVAFGRDGHGDEKTMLNLAKSAVKYLARIGVTPSIK